MLARGRRRLEKQHRRITDLDLFNHDTSNTLLVYLKARRIKEISYFYPTYVFSNNNSISPKSMKVISATMMRFFYTFGFG